MSIQEPGSAQKQHVDIHRKLLLRRHLLSRLGDDGAGAVYLPFCGEGDIAAELYAGRAIFGADKDPARTAVAQSRLARAQIKTADCDTWPFPGLSDSISVADFDSYAYPYASFRAFWESASKADRMLLLFTDGERQAIKRSGYYHTPSGAKKYLKAAAKRDAYNKYWIAHIKPWFVDHVKPYVIVETLHYLRKDMLYWGAVIDRAAPSQDTPPLDDELTEVESALYEAAISGNVPAIQMWLYNRAPHRWRIAPGPEADQEEALPRPEPFKA